MSQTATNHRHIDWMKAFLSILCVCGGATLAQSATTGASTSSGSAAVVACPTTRLAKLCVLGGDDAGTGAAWAAARLGVPTVLVLTHRRDLGGDPTTFYHDGAGMVPSGGGLNVELLDSGNSSNGDDANVPGGPGAAFIFFDTLFRTAPLNQSLEIIEGYIAAPNSGVVDEKTGRVQSVELINGDSGERCVLQCQYVIDGSPEGFGASAFGLPIVFGREARANSSDPTLDNEQYAGRRTFAVGGTGPPVDSWSDPAVEVRACS
jgi:hypothetical protein